MDTLDWIAKWADYTPNRIALTSFDTDEKYTYYEVHKYANRLVEKLESYNIQQGDRIAVLAEHGLDFIILFAACQRLGSILVPLNYRLSVIELQTLIKDCTPALFLYSDKQHKKFEALKHHISKGVSLTTIKHFYKDNIEVAEKNYSIKEDNPLFIFYTSGTTGTPKGVIYTNKMMFWNSLNTSMQLGITSRDSTINTLPPYHTSGWNIFVTPLLHKGAHIGLVEKFEAEKIVCLLEINKISLFIALPTMLAMMQKTPLLEKVTLKHLRFIITGGETVPKSLVTYWKTSKNINIRPGYGLTEAGPSITSLHHDIAATKPTSIGKPNFYLKTKIINTKGNEVRINEVGEFCIKGEIVTPGYWNNSVETSNKIKKGWLHTGDYVYKDKDGFLYLKGRKDDRYISGGENIHPQEVSNKLLEFNGIIKAVVLSMKDDVWGQCGVAFVVTKKDITEIMIQNFLKKNLVKFKHPKHIIILNDIPVTSVGKISRKKLLNYYEIYKESVNKSL